MAEITDRESALAWLETQEHQTRIWFACRCALRAVPALGNEPTATLGGLAFANFRAILISGAAGTCPAPEMSRLKKAAASFSASSADSVVPDTWPGLWHAEGLPIELRDGWQSLHDFMQADLQTWRFWRDWYEAILKDEPLDWALSFRIATELTVDDWEKGGDDWLISARHVARRIAHIRIEFATSIGPEMVLQNDGLYGFAKDADIGVEPLAYASSSVKSALDAALIGGSANGLSETSSETVLIRSALNEYQDSPSMVATNFWNACMSLNKNIGDI
ncbi:MAG: hypothetical protein ABJL99_20045 [Aliishimia sp.]